MQIFPEYWRRDNLQDEGGGEDRAAAGDGDPVVLGLLAVERSED